MGQINVDGFVAVSEPNPLYCHVHFWHRAVHPDPVDGEHHQIVSVAATLSCEIGGLLGVHSDQQVEAAGIGGFLRKPVTGELLVEAIARVMGR